LSWQLSWQLTWQPIPGLTSESGLNACWNALIPCLGPPGRQNQLPMR
jgi:hypothetical protein